MSPSGFGHHGRKAEEFPIMRTMLALAALFLSSCSGSTTGDNSPDGNPGDDDDDTTMQPDKGGMTVTVNGVAEVLEVYDLQGNFLGLTGEEILNLTPGTLQIAVGFDDKVSLAGLPYYVDSDEQYLIGQGSVAVVKGQVASATVDLTVAPQHQIEQIDCGWPYENSRGSCEGDRTTDPSQWVYVDLDRIVRGSRISTVVSGVLMELSVDGDFTVTSTDSMLDITGDNFDPTLLSIEFIRVDEAFEWAEQVVISIP